MENKCRVVLTRPSEWMNRLRKFKILVDGNKIATIASGESQELLIEPGVHTLSAKVDWCGSRDYPLVVEPGKTLHMRVKNGMKYYLPLAIPVFLVLLISIYFRFSDIAKPLWFSYLTPAAILPVGLYLAYYLTFGRKDYLVIDDDPVFSAP